MWNPECANLFPALVMVSPVRPGTFLEPSTVSGFLCLEPAVSAQPGLGSVRWVSLAESIPQVSQAPLAVVIMKPHPHLIHPG